MRFRAAVLVLGLTAVAHADTYTLINFDDRPPATIGGLNGEPGGPVPGTTGQVLVYPQATFYGGVLVPSHLTYFDIYYNGYDASQAVPPYSNSYDTFDLFPAESPGDLFLIQLSTPVNEIDFDIFNSNFVVNAPLEIDVVSGTGELLPGTTVGFTGGHFDSKANGIQEVFISDYSDLGYYMGIDNVELNAYLAPAPTPEPSTLYLLSTGVLAVGCLLWKRRGTVAGDC